MGKRDKGEIEELYSIAAGFIASGVVLIAACVPSAALLAVLAGKPPLASILLLQSDVALSDFLANPNGALNYSGLALVAALLGLYGVISLCVPLLFLVGRAAGYLKLLSLSWGMFLGLEVTSLWYDWISTPERSIFQSYTPKIAYLYLAFLLAEAIKTLLEHLRLSALPYLYAVDGVFGVVAVLIISAGYSPTFADVLLGPLFLVAVAGSILLAEFTIVRPLTILFIAFGQTMSDARLSRRLRAASPRKRFSVLWRRVGEELSKARTRSFGERVEIIDGAISTVFRSANRNEDHMHAVRFDWRWVAGIFVFNLLFPIGAGFLARAVL